MRFRPLRQHQSNVPKKTPKKLLKTAKNPRKKRSIVDGVANPTRSEASAKQNGP